MRHAAVALGLLLYWSTVIGLPALLIGGLVAGAFAGSNTAALILIALAFLAGVIALAR